MANIFTDNTITLTKGTTTEITLNTADKYVLDDIVVNVTPQAGSFNNQPTSGETYNENKSAATVIPAEGYLYLNKGWFNNTKISLGHLIPDDVEYTNAGVSHILSGYEAYDTDGKKLVGTMATVNPTFDGGDVTVTPSIINLVKPKLSVNASGSFTSATSYGVTSTTPTGTDGTDYLTIDGGATVDAAGSVQAQGVANRGAVLYNGATTGFVDKADNTEALAASTNTTQTSGASSIDVTITDNFTPLYIPVTTVTGDTNSGTVSKTGGSATTNITNPTVKINKSGKFVPEDGGVNYGVTTEQPDGEDGVKYLSLSIDGTTSSGSVSGTATIDYSRAAVTSSELARGAINLAAGSTLLSSDTGSLSQEITGSVSAEVSGDVNYFVPVVQASASVSAHEIENPTVVYKQSSSYSINGTTQSSVPSGVVVSSSQPSDFDSSSYITVTPGATVTNGSSVSTATASIDKGITDGTSATDSNTKSVPVTSSVDNNCYIKVYIGDYSMKEIYDLSMLDYKGSALKRRETANCYIVSETSYYELPLVYGCGIVDGNTNSASYTQISGDNTQPFFNYLNRQINSPFIEEDTGMTAVGASVVLTDTADFVIDDVYLIERHLCKFLRFHVSSMPTLGGNATIAVKDETGQIMWSWHIWAYPFALSTFTHTNASGNTYNILDVNLGWVKDSVDSKYGTSPYYQWGRKDPMLRNDASASVGSFNTTGCATSVAATIQNPNVFNTYERTNYNWWTNDGTPVTFYNYWDASQTTTDKSHRNIVKTVYDPCLVGFHIPCGATFKGFSTRNGGTWDNGYTWDNNFFQAVGNRGLDSGGIFGVGGSSWYWTAASNSAMYSYILDFCSGSVYNQYYTNRAYASSVRPVARS